MQSLGHNQVIKIGVMYMYIYAHTYMYVYIYIHSQRWDGAGCGNLSL